METCDNTGAYTVKDVSMNHRICISCRKDFNTHSQHFISFVSDDLGTDREVMFQWNITFPNTSISVDMCFNCFYAGLEAQYTYRRMNG